MGWGGVGKKPCSCPPPGEERRDREEEGDRIPPRLFLESPMTGEPWVPFSNWTMGQQDPCSILWMG